MIKYVEVGAPNDEKNSLPYFKTLGEVEEYFYILEANLADLERQIEDYQMFGICPNTTPGRTTGQWLLDALESKKCKVWKRSILQATLDKAYKSKLEEKLDTLERRMFELDAIVGDEQRKRKAELRNIVNRVKKLGKELVSLRNKIGV